MPPNYGYVRGIRNKYRGPGRGPGRFRDPDRGSRIAADRSGRIPG